jgi:hypothetical protein
MLPITIAVQTGRKILRLLPVLPLFLILPSFRESSKQVTKSSSSTALEMSFRDSVVPYRKFEMPDIAVLLKRVPVGEDSDDDRRHATMGTGSAGPDRHAAANGPGGKSRKSARHESLRIGNEYYSLRNAKYLGRDGAETGEMRLIDEESCNRIRDESNGTATAAATAKLQAKSISVKVDSLKIQSDLQIVKDSSIDYKREYQMYLFIDRRTGVLSSVIGPPGDNNNSYPECTPSPDSGVNYLHGDTIPASKILIGQAHGHPATESTGSETVSEMSPADCVAASKLQIPIYGVDAMYGDIGSPGCINRSNPDGSTTDRVGWTKGEIEGMTGLTIFSIGLDALKKWGRSATPSFR